MAESDPQSDAYGDSSSCGIDTCWRLLGEYGTERCCVLRSRRKRTYCVCVCRERMCSMEYEVDSSCGRYQRCRETAGSLRRREYVNAVITCLPLSCRRLGVCLPIESGTVHELMIHMSFQTRLQMEEGVSRCAQARLQQRNCASGQILSEV